jgi:hypothetical protein
VQWLGLPILGVRHVSEDVTSELRIKVQIEGLSLHLSRICDLLRVSVNTHRTVQAPLHTHGL